MMNESETFSQIRVRYAETDQMGVAYHGAILPWFEIARTDFLRQTGMSYRQMEESCSIHFAVVEAAFHYIRRIHYDDLLVARARLSGLGTVELSFTYELMRDKEVCVTGSSRHACVSSNGRPVRIPEAIRDVLNRRLS